MIRLTALVFLLMLSPALITVAQIYQAFDPSEISIDAGPFRKAQDADLKYILELDVDRLLAPFRIDAGINFNKEPYPNWENTGLNGHIGGHYLSALALMKAASGNTEVSQRLDYMINALAECQKKNGNGYVSGIPEGKEIWKEIAAGKINADNFSLNGKWVPLYNIHKLFAGLRDAFVVGRNKQALQVLTGLSNWFSDVISGLSDDQVQLMLKSEHGGMNEVFADMYAITKNPKYLAIAKRLNHQMILIPLEHGEDKLTSLHANTQIPKVIGFKKIADVSSDQPLSDAAAFFWKNVTEKRSVSIGGNSVREHFHPVKDFSSMLESNQGPETCNTYNMLRLSKLLYLSEGKPEYLSYYERAMYNHILSSQHPDGGFVYFTPMRPRHYRVYSEPQKSFWCCVGSGLENHGKYNELVYVHNNRDIFVNFFIPSTLKWKEKGITVVQKTRFPENEKTELTIKEAASSFGMHVRIPAWTKPEKVTILINGEKTKFDVSADSFASLNRKWRKGDRIEITLPMETKLEYLPDGSPWASFIHGPIVLAAVTDTTDLQGLHADESRMGHVAEGKMYPLEDAPALVGDDMSILSGIHPVVSTPLTFDISAVVYPEKFAALKLVPFYTVHDARYMVYWPVSTKARLDTLRETFRKTDEFKLKLAAHTIDEVSAGEQQPESDHFFKGEKAVTGIFNNLHWRSSSAWFSYRLQNKDSKGWILRITYVGEPGNRAFSIVVNGSEIRHESFNDITDKVFSLDYIIPNKIIKSGDELTVKFAADKNSSTPRIIHVRLLKGNLFE
jgi:uncharacterized protein